VEVADTEVEVAGAAIGVVGVVVVAAAIGAGGLVAIGAATVEAGAGASGVTAAGGNFLGGRERATGHPTRIKRGTRARR